MSGVISNVFTNPLKDIEPKNRENHAKTLETPPTPTLESEGPTPADIVTDNVIPYSSIKSSTDLGKPAPLPANTKKLVLKKKEYPQKSKPETPATTGTESPIPSTTNKQKGIHLAALDYTDEWVEVKKKKTRQSLPGVKWGKAAPGATLLEASEKRKYLHLFYVKLGTTEQQVRNHLATVCGVEDCTIETLKSRGNYASFKLGVSDQYYDRVTAVENWTENICIKPWRQNFRAKREYSKEHQKNTTT